MNKIPTDIINIEAGNDVVLCFPIVFRRFDNGKAIDEIPDRLDFIHSVVITHNGVAQSYDFTTDGNKVVVPIPATLETGSYDVRISGNNNGAISTVRKSSFCIVPFSYMANSSDYIQGSPILMPDSVFVASSSIPIDDALSETSTNPVQNKVVTEALKAVDEKASNSVQKEDLANYVTNDELQEYPTKENLTETLGEYATHEELDNAKSEIDSSMQSMQGRIETMQYDIDQAKNEASSAQIAADSAYQRAEEALGATHVTDPTTNTPGVAINEALYNVYDSATHVTDPTSGIANTPINEALSNLNNKIQNSNDSDEILKVLLRNFGTSATFDMDKNSISFGDVDFLLFLIYQKCKEFIANYENVNNEDLPYILGDRYITIGIQGVITPTMLVQGVSFDNPYMQIVVDEKTSALFGQLAGVQGLKYIRMMDSPIGNSYWKLVLDDGTEILPIE